MGSQTTHDRTTATSWQLNADADGPKITDEGSGIMGARTAADALARLQAAVPAADNDLAPRVYVAKRIIPYPLDLAGAVPAGTGRRICSSGGIALSGNPIIPAFGGVIRGIVVRVNRNTDPQAYYIRVYVQEVLVDTLTLPATTYQAFTVATTGTFSANQRIKVQVERVSGAAASVWDLLRGTLYTQENILAA